MWSDRSLRGPAMSMCTHVREQEGSRPGPGGSAGRGLVLRLRSSTRFRGRVFMLMGAFLGRGASSRVFMGASITSTRHSTSMAELPFFIIPLTELQGSQDEPVTCTKSVLFGLSSFVSHTLVHSHQ